MFIAKADGVEWFSIVQAASFVGIASQTTFYRRLKANKFPAGTRNTANKSVLWHRTTLEEYLKRQEGDKRG